MGVKSLSCLAAVMCFGLVAGTDGTDLWSRGFVRVTWLSSFVYGDSLYLDGGEIVNETYGYTQGSTLQIDLTKYWSNSNVTAKYADKPLLYPYSRSPTLWSDGSHLYSYGGTRYFYQQCLSTIACTNPIYNGGSKKALGAKHLKHHGRGAQVITGKARRKLVDYPTDLWVASLNDFGKEGAWAKATGQQPPNSIHPIQGAAVTQYDNKVYALGGYSGLPYTTATYNPLVAVPGFTTWNSDSTSWLNKTTVGYQPNGFNAFGQAVNVPFGSHGAIVYIGGYAPGSSGFAFADLTSTPDNLQDMSRINVYDIGTGKWYTQIAGGLVPPSRFSFCASSASEPGSHTAEIYIHAGFASTRNSEPYDSQMANVFVLSLPSFVWMQVPNSEQTLMRGGTTCKTIGNRQMVVVGGLNPADDIFGETADPWTNGIQLFDLTDWKWTGNYNPNAKPYKRNPKLLRQIRRAPYPLVWNSPATKRYFMNYAPQKIVPANSNGAGDGGPDAGTIAGAVVGAVAALALILTFFVCCWKRRKAQQKRDPNLSEPGSQKVHAVEAPHQNGKAPPQELGAEKKPVELGPPQLWELEQPAGNSPSAESETRHSTMTNTPVSEDTKIYDDLGRPPVYRYEMEA